MAHCPATPPSSSRSQAARQREDCYKLAGRQCQKVRVDHLLSDSVFNHERHSESDLTVFCFKVKKLLDYNIFTASLS